MLFSITWHKKDLNEVYLTEFKMIELSEFLITGRKEMHYVMLEKMQKYVTAIILKKKPFCTELKSSMCDVASWGYMII